MTIGFTRNKKFIPTGGNKPLTGIRKETIDFSFSPFSGGIEIGGWARKHPEAPSIDESNWNWALKTGDEVIRGNNYHEMMKALDKKLAENARIHPTKQKPWKIEIKRDGKEYYFSKDDPWHKMYAGSV